MLPVFMIVGGLLALWFQAQPSDADQKLPTGILRAVGGMLIIGGVIAFFSQSLAFLLVGVGVLVGYLAFRQK